MSQYGPKDMFFKALDPMHTFRNQENSHKNSYLRFLLRNRGIWEGQAHIPTEHRPAGTGGRHPSSLLRATLTTCLACTCSWAGDPAFTSCLLHRVTFLGNSHVHSIAFICNSHSSLNSCRLGNSQPRIRNWSNCQSLAFFDQ